MTGRLKGRSCVRTTKRNHSHKRCIRLVKIGHFNHADGAGSNRFHFTGRVASRKLAPGHYLLVAVARNSAGAGHAVTVGFAIKASRPPTDAPKVDLDQLRAAFGVDEPGAVSAGHFVKCALGIWSIEGRARLAER